MLSDSASVFAPSRPRYRPSVRLLGRAISTLATLALGAGLIWLTVRNLDLEELEAGFRSVALLPLALGALFLMGGPLVLAYEWGIILRGGGERSLRYRTLASMTIVTLFWQNIAHFMLGYGYAVHRFVKREGLRPAAALGVVSIDQLAEGIAKALFSGALVFYFAAPERAATLLPVLFLGALIGYFALRPVLRRTVARLALREERSPSGRKRLVNGAMIERYSRMWNERALWTCAALAMFKKMFRVAATAAVQYALGLDLPLVAPFVFIAVLDCATLLPLIPGHMGIYEATAVATYARLGASDESALLVGVLYHAVFLVAAIVPAVILWLSLAASRLVRPVVVVYEAKLEEITGLVDEEPAVVAAEGLAA